MDIKPRQCIAALNAHVRSGFPLVGDAETSVYAKDIIETIQRLVLKLNEANKAYEASEVDSGFEALTAYHHGYTDGLESAQPKWISVEERLPDDLEEVLILVKETEFYGQYKELSKSYFCQYIGCVDDGEWFTVWCHGHRYIKDTAKEPYADKLEVTHWMPLPEPPKEET